MHAGLLICTSTAIVAACVGAGCTPAAAPTSTSASATSGGLATWILTHGVVQRHARPPASAIALQGARILAVGTDADIEALRGPRTTVTDLHGGFVVASLTDAHGHLVGLGKVLTHATIDGCASAAACAEKVRAFAVEHPDAAWITGGSWDQTRFPNATYPTREDLDAVVRDRPVWLRRVDGHAAWANSKALALAGVDASTQAPSGGRIEKKPDGTPTGVLQDAAMSLVARVIPEPTEADRERELLVAQTRAFSLGLTGVHEMAIDAAHLATFERLARDGRLKMRVNGYAMAGGLGAPVDEGAIERLLARGADAPSPERRFTLRGIKLWADGALGSRGAALLEPYADDSAHNGYVITPPAVIERTARAALARGMQIAVHAIGDAGNRAVLDAYERAGCGAKVGHRFRVEHAQVITPEDIERMAKLGVIASVQPTHATSDMRWAEQRLGHARIANAYAWRKLIAAHVPIALGSDFPVESPDPRGGIFAALTRQDQDLKPEGGWYPEQRLTVEEALDGFTIGAAYAAFEEKFRGDAAPGMVADLTVFDRAIDPRMPRSVLDARVTLTVVGGEAVYQP